MCSTAQTLLRSKERLRSGVGHHPLQAVHGLQLGTVPKPQGTRESVLINTFHNPVTFIPIYNTSFVLEEGNKTIYVDPAMPASFSGLPPADIILITDATPDHMDRAAIAAISTRGTEIIAPAAVAKIITKAHTLKTS